MRNNRSNLQHICEEGCVAKKRRSNLKNICEEGCVAKKNWSNLQNICEEGCVAKTLVKFAEYLRGELCGENTGQICRIFARRAVWRKNSFV